MADVEATAVYLADADRVEKLMDIVINCAAMPNLVCIKQAALNELGQIEADLHDQIYPPPEEPPVEEPVTEAA